MVATIPRRRFHEKEERLAFQCQLLPMSQSCLFVCLFVYLLLPCCSLANTPRRNHKAQGTALDWLGRGLGHRGLAMHSGNEVSFADIGSVLNVSSSNMAAMS